MNLRGETLKTSLCIKLVYCDVGLVLDDGQAEALTEEQTGGKPTNRKSLLDHQWHFDVTAGNRVIFLANAWAPASPDGDKFEFTFSINGSDWLHLAEITATFDDGSMLSAVMTDVSGPVSIRRFTGLCVPEAAKHIFCCAGTE